MNSSQIKCEINSSVAIFSNKLFQLGVATNSIISLLSIIANILLLLCFFRLSVSHKNIRILSCNFSGACVIASGFFLYRGILFWSNLSQPCNLHVSLSSCTFMSAPGNIAIFSLIGSMIGIAIERTWATLRHANYRNNSYSFSLVMSILSWLLYVLVVPLGFLGQPQMLQAPFCISLLMTNVLPTFILSCVMVILALSTIFVYTKLISLNKRRLAEFANEQVQLSLASRLEIRQSVELTSLFLFTLISYTMLELTYALVFPTALYIIADDLLVPRFILGVATNNLTSVFMVSHPLWFFLKSQRLRTKLRIILQSCLSQKHRTRVDPSVAVSKGNESEDWKKELENHFQMLKGNWSVKKATNLQGRAYVVS